MNRVKYHGIASVALSLLFLGQARALTINFDPQGGVPAGDLPSGLSAMGNSPGSAVPAGSQLSNQYEADGALFSSSSAFVAVVDIGGSSASSPNGIGGVTSDGLLSYADPVMVTFVEPGTTTQGVTSNVSIQADATGISGQFATLSAFDINGHLLDSETLEDVGAEVWMINLTGIHSVLFNFPTTSTGALTTGSAFGNGTGIALDDLTFGTVTAAGSTGPTQGGSTGTGTGGGAAVPLPPAGWSAVVMLGLLGVIRMLRGRAWVAGTN